MEDYNILNKISLAYIFDKVPQKFKYLSNAFIERLDDEKIVVEEGLLRQLCSNLKIENPVVLLERKIQEKTDEDDNECFSPALFGIKSVLSAKNTEEMKTVYRLVADEIQKINIEKTNLSFIQKEGFANYFTNPVFEVPI